MIYEGRPVVVTGGGHGIGAALAAEAARRGAGAVAVVDVDEDAAVRVAGGLSHVVAASAWVCDVSDPGQVADVARRIVAAQGVPALVCANAGVGPPAGPLLDVDLDTIRWVLGVNTVGLLLTLQEFGRRMVDAGEPGWLLATGSEHALGRPHLGMGVYTASKHAVLGLCDVLRAELPDHVGVSVLCPGLTRTELWNATSRRPEAFGGPVPGDPVSAAVLDQGMDAATVAARALDGVEAGRFLVPTHHHARRYAEARWVEIAEAFDRLAEVDTRDFDVDRIVSRLLESSDDTS